MQYLEEIPRRPERAAMRVELTDGPRGASADRQRQRVFLAGRVEASAENRNNPVPAKR